MVVFGAHKAPHRPKHTHSFATFVKVMGDGPLCDGCAVEAYTVSWLPKSLDIQLGRPNPEPGVNLDLHATLWFVLGSEAKVSQWGPFEIRKELYDRAVARVAELQSGSVEYKALDSGHPAKRVSNCIHALLDLTHDCPAVRIASPLPGDPASYAIARKFEPWFIDAGQVHSWLSDRLGLWAYPITRRDLEDGNPKHPHPRKQEAVGGGSEYPAGHPLGWGPAIPH